VQVKYAGYIRLQTGQALSFRRLEAKPLPQGFDYGGLRLEARQKLAKVRPSTIGQASRIPGVNPADINVLIIAMKLFEKTNR
jgi:tRNA uridine 5-carboxymethylaminomethyl modification enzyme